MRSLATIWLLALSVFAEDWNRFRGPNGSGASTSATNLPVDLGPTSKSLAWKTAVPFGQSSPIVVKNRVILTGTDTNDDLLTLAYDAASGKLLWKQALKPAHHHELYKKNDPASPSAAADDRAVYAFFADFGLISYTLDGKERWRHPLGPFESFYGMSSSPVVSGNMLFLLCDQAKGSFLLALDKETGKQRWRRERPDYTEGWSVPIVHENQIIAVGTNRVDAYFAATGESNWWIPLSSGGSMGSPVIHDGHVIVTAMGSDQPWMPSWSASVTKLDKDGDAMISKSECKSEDWQEHFGWVDSNHDGKLDQKEWDTARALGVGGHGAVAIPLDSKGALKPEAVRWRFKRNLSYVPAPVIYNNVFFMVKDGGIVSALDPATGKVHKQGRAEKALGEYFASPVAADGKVFLLSAEGKLTVLKAQPQWEILGSSEFNEECLATPAIADNSIFVRTRGHLYRFKQ